MEFIERCCDSINNSFEVYLALLVGAGVAVIVIYICNRRLSEKAKTKKDCLCLSPSCFRCNSDDGFERLTKKKFTEYLQNSLSPDSLSNLKEAILANRESRPTDGTHQNPTVLWLRSIRPRIWFDPVSTHAGDVKILEDNFPLILEEYRTLTHEPGWIINQKRDGCWKVYHLMSQGVFTVNATRCPRTVDVLRNLKSLMTGSIFGYATFSVLEPGTIVTPHFGSTNCRIRCHLGLQVDPNTCQIEVADQRRSWENGKCLLFDDSFLHGARHRGPSEDQPRVVLMVDLWHSQLNQEEILCIRSVYSSDLIFECSSFTNTD